ncbi:FAD-binding domain-containing protein [Rickenella mellea]|uniref:FAD-binding domain-containing protein n=1 Tax=Rickenella mellea TaxID=50990 RepID=A0A4Y7Q9X8_9AGAM|nr:FAD-binding domain-containing protein [Rickenella mellea]
MLSLPTVPLLLAAYLGGAVSAQVTTDSHSAASKACGLLKIELPNLIAFPGSAQYGSDIAHWATSSVQNATCSIEPQTSKDVATILGIVGRDDIRAPFAVKGGGHAYNLGHSSTSGVQISMAKFNALTHDPVANTVTIGTGLTWDQVYTLLEPLGIMVAGGRVPGVGIAGLSLGGGYSWKTDQFGLTVDTIVAHDIVLPSGKFVHVTNKTQPDLFFALKGGLNNFGVVTAITYESHPQTLVFAGSVAYAPNVTDQFNNAVANFDLKNSDPKAQVIVTYASVFGQFSSSIDLFYDAPSVPPGVFDEFLSIPSVKSDVKTRKFTEFLSTTFGNGDLGIGPFKVAQNVIPVLKYTIPVLNQMVNQVTTLGASLTQKFNGSVVVVTCSAEPFTLPFAHSKGGAYPHPPSRQVTPGSPFIAVQATADPTQEAILANSVKQLSHAVQATAVQEGQSRWDDLLYPNYAIAGTPLTLMYGSNVPRLNQIAKNVDPRGVMQLTGGPKFGAGHT